MIISREYPSTCFIPIPILLAERFGGMISGDLLNWISMKLGYKVIVIVFITLPVNPFLARYD
jgi:hypothetical protein